MRPALQSTLDDLQLTYLDLYLIHSPVAYKAGEETMPKDENGMIIATDVHFNETWKEMEKAVDDGLIRSIGE